MLFSAPAEALRAVTVIITLVYLATQIRQNTNQLKGESIGEINNTAMELISVLRDDHDLFVLLIRSITNCNNLKPQEQA